jgi:hypothetical protein
MVPTWFSAGTVQVSFIFFNEVREKLKNWIGILILRKCFQKLFSIYQFLKLKKVKQIQKNLFFFSCFSLLKNSFIKHILKTKKQNTFYQKARIAHIYCTTKESVCIYIYTYCPPKKYIYLYFFCQV